MLKLPGRYVLYYSARDMLEGWLQADGTPGPGRGFAYRHIGYAALPAEEHSRSDTELSRGHIDGEAHWHIARHTLHCNTVLRSQAAHTTLNLPSAKR